MTTEIVRVVQHPDDPQIVMLHSPYSARELMGNYEPARYHDDLRAYLLHVDMLDAFERYARYAGLYVLDERTMTPVQVNRSQLCDICTKTEKVCQTAAGNRGQNRDHDFISVAQADVQRADANRRALESRP